VGAVPHHRPLGLVKTWRADDAAPSGQSNGTPLPPEEAIASANCATAKRTGSGGRRHIGGRRRILDTLRTNEGSGARENDVRVIGAAERTRGWPRQAHGSLKTAEWHLGSSAFHVVAGAHLQQPDGSRFSCGAPAHDSERAGRLSRDRGLYCGRTRFGFPTTPAKTTSTFAGVVPLFLPLCQVLTTSRNESPAL